ncbi:hypothetical protein DFO62_103362 [Serratia fonticola]|nr:hypothetical protein DFO62_103362 [Serratia fonticola]
MIKQVNHISYLEKNMISINNNKLKIRNTDIEVSLSKNQKKLIICLMKDINDKKRIITLIWGEGDSSLREMSYHQLIHKTRNRLSNHGFPDDFILTIPRYGLCLNKKFVGYTLKMQDLNYTHEFQ